MTWAIVAVVMLVLLLVTLITCRRATDPFDVEVDPPSTFPGETPHGVDCPDTEPTSPGALDSDLARLQ